MSRGVEKDEVTRFLEAWFALRQFIQATNFNRFQKAGLSATQFMTLNLLPHNGDGITAGELARRMNLKPATVAKTLDSLEARDMIARLRSAADGRLVLVKITKAGIQFQNAAAGQFRNQLTALFEAMLPEERHGLLVGLQSLVRAASRGSTPVPSTLTREPDAAAPAKRSSRRSRQQ